MQVRFIGDGDRDAEGEPKPATVFGVTFPVDVPVDISGLDKAQQAKLAGNPAFEAVAAPTPKRPTKGDGVGD